MVSELRTTSDADDLVDQTLIGELGAKGSDWIHRPIEDDQRIENARLDGTDT